MYEIGFIYNGIETTILCKDTERMKDIFTKFTLKTQTDINSLFFLYDGTIVNEELTLKNLKKAPDQNTNKITILVYPKYIATTIQKKGLLKSKEIICPQCKENCLLKIDGFNMINLYGCKNNHVNQLSFEEFEKTQFIDTSKIICSNYNNCGNNKYKSYHNQFYRCLSCKNNLCPLCDSHHDKSHSIIDYDKIHYLCEIHNDLFTSFCNNCNNNLCMLCEKNHNKNHNIIEYKNLIENKNDLNNEINKFKKKIEIFSNDVKKIVNILNGIIKKMNIYFEINNDLLNNYEPQNKNFQILNNIKEVRNNILMKDIDEIVKEKNIIYKFEKIMQFTNNADTDEVIIKYKILNNNMNPKVDDSLQGMGMQNFPIPSMDMENGQMRDMGQFMGMNSQYSLVDIFGQRFKENNYKNCEFIYEGKNYNLKEDIYVYKNLDTIEIKLMGINKITNMCGMFEGCSSLLSISGISKINTSKITNMSSIFANCTSLKYIDDISRWDTSKVTNMSSLFENCEVLISLPDISKWNTSKVIYMNDIFRLCSSLISLPDISKWDTSNAIYMSGLFSFCSSLQSLPDISKWKTDNVSLMTGMFYDCETLKSISDISKWDISKNNYLGNIFAQCKSLIIPFEYSFDINIDFINVGFSDTRTGIKMNFIISPDTRVDQLLKLYLLRTGEYDLIDKQIIKFIYNYHLPLEFGDYKTIGEIFNNVSLPKIKVSY